MLTALLVIVILVVLIVAHELGHFIAAKLSGVKVDEFGVGYPPRAFLLGTIRGTEYTLNWIPFGGFVRLYGDSGESAHGVGGFVDASYLRQALILVAGVLANVILAWVLFTCAYLIGIPRAIDTPAPGQPIDLLISDVVPGSPAAAAGIAPGDQLLGMTDAQGVALGELTPQAVEQFVQARPGQHIVVSYLHDQATTTASVTPANAVIPGQAGQPAIGVALVLISTQAIPAQQAMYESLLSVKSAFETVAAGLWSIIDGLFHGSPDLQDVVGPVGLVSVVGQAARNGLGNVLALAAFISVNLALINLIPIPALDGGRLVMVGVEAVTRRPAPRSVVIALNAIGIALIIFLMIFVTYNDIARLLA